MKSTTDDSQRGLKLRDIPTYETAIAHSAAFRLMRKVVDAELKPHGISMMQWLFIGAAHRAGEAGVRITDLARQLGTTLPYATTTVNTLERKNYLWRAGHGDDSRSKLIYIDKEFAKAFTAIENGIREAVRVQYFKDLSTEELKAYITIIHKLGKIT